MYSGVCYFAVCFDGNGRQRGLFLFLCWGLGLLGLSGAPATHMIGDSHHRTIHPLKTHLDCTIFSSMIPVWKTFRLSQGLPFWKIFSFLAERRRENIPERCAYFMSPFWRWQEKSAVLRSMRGRDFLSKFIKLLKTYSHV